MTAVALVDTNILVYRFDPRFPEKQGRATAVLYQGLADEIVRVPHQAIIEFVAAVTRPRRSGGPLLSVSDALYEAEEMVTQFPVLYPNEAVVRLALRGAAAYRLSWFEAHLWAYAEHFGLAELWSEDFQHDRMYGTVRAVKSAARPRGRLMGERRPPLQRSKTTRPPSTVRSTSVSVVRSGAMVSRSCDSTTRSASLPTSRVPFSSSSKVRWAAMRV